MQQHRPYLVVGDGQRVQVGQGARVPPARQVRAVHPQHPDGEVRALAGRPLQPRAGVDGGISGALGALVLHVHQGAQGGHQARVLGHRDGLHPHQVKGAGEGLGDEVRCAVEVVSRQPFGHEQVRRIVEGVGQMVGTHGQPCHVIGGPVVAEGLD